MTFEKLLWFGGDGMKCDVMVGVEGEKAASEESIYISSSRGKFSNCDMTTRF